MSEYLTDGHLLAEADRHQPDPYGNGCSCGFAVHSTEHVLLAVWHGLIEPNVMPKSTLPHPTIPYYRQIWDPTCPDHYENRFVPATPACTCGFARVTIASR